MKTIIGFLLTSLVSLHSQAQTGWKDGLVFCVDIGVNRSYLTYNLPNLDNKISYEFKAGVTVERSIFKWLDLRSGLRIGMKPKTNFQEEGFPSYYLHSIDESYDLRNHFFVELPVYLLFHWKKWQIGGGMMGRHYLNMGDSGDRDFLKGRYETGLNAVLSYNLTNKVRIGGEAYFGLTEVYSAYFLQMNEHLKVKNNFWSLNLAYRIK